MKTLLIYSTTDGHTIEICQRIVKVIEQNSQQVTMVSIHDIVGIDLLSFDKIVVGASIRYGKHSQEVIDFIEKNVAILDSKPNAFFSVNVVARKPEKNKPDTNPYVKKFLKNISWKPKHVEVFAGKIDYPKYSTFDRLMIRFIMWMTKGPTHPSTVVEFTNWQQVEDFGRTIIKM